MDPADYFRERYRTHTQIREGGALGNLAEGIEIETNGIQTRLIAWPGNGFQTLSVHVLTVPKEKTGTLYAYDMAEEALVCFKGRGQVKLGGEKGQNWVNVRPGDVVYCPRGLSRNVRNLNHDEDFVLVSCISPPQFDLYAAAGFYDPNNKVMNYEAIQYAKINVRSVQYDARNEMAYHDGIDEWRPWNMTNQEIQQKGAVFSAFRGGALVGLVSGGGGDGEPVLTTGDGAAPAPAKAPMLLILFAGFGTGNTGFNFACMTPGMTADIHTHPVSDEVVVNWWGGNLVWLGDAWHQTRSHDCVLAPCGVRHGGVVAADAKDYLLVGGLAAPPQLDLLINSGYYQDGRFTRPEFSELDYPGAPPSA